MKIKIMKQVIKIQWELHKMLYHLLLNQLIIIKKKMKIKLETRNIVIMIIIYI